MKMKRFTLVLGVLFMGGVLATSMTSCDDAAKEAPKDDATEVAAPAANDEAAEVAEPAVPAEKCGEGKCGEGKCGEGKTDEVAPESNEAAAAAADVDEAKAAAVEEAPAEKKCGGK